MQEITPASEKLECKAQVLTSLLLFTKTFYKIRTGREFEISKPDGRESHYIQICRKLVGVLEGSIKRLIINVPPRYGKTELLIHFVAWALARYPDSNFLYVSYSHSLAKKQTQTIRDILSLSRYRNLFDVHISEESSAKDDFETINRGSVYAAGAGGTICGRGAGIMGCKRFGGAVIIDDIHKPDEVTSDLIRGGIIDWYYNTMRSRLNNGKDTPMVFIGQRLHEDDLPAHLIKTGEWDTLIIPALDVHNNALHPLLHSKEDLLRMKELEPYVFAAQYQQDPQPAGGGIFKPEWFQLMDLEPEIIATLITADTAETDKDYNDPTVFSFFGLYKIKQKGIEIDLYGLHWIDCVQLWIEPKDLQTEFFNFYSICMRHKVKPQMVAIEKKSTGVTLLSVLKSYQGLQTIEIERNASSGSKVSRFLEIQYYIASKLVSLPRNGRHTNMCIDHCRKITANNSHRYDDIADTLYDGVKIGLIDQILINKTVGAGAIAAKKAVKNLADHFNKIDQLRSNRKW